MRSWVAGILLLVGAAASAAAQDPSLTVTLQNGVPRVQAAELLANGKFLGLMRSGFPLRLHYRLELWRTKSGWFDDHMNETAWDVVAHYDPLADDFVLVRTGGIATRFARVEALAQALQIPYKVTLAPKGSGELLLPVPAGDLDAERHGLTGSAAVAQGGRVARGHRRGGT